MSLKNKISFTNEKEMIRKCLYDYVQRYNTILNSFYPSKNSTGFTERNLTVNFSKAYEKFNADSITWFEFTFRDKNNNKDDLHIDAIIIDSEHKNIFFIEAKRFKVPRKIRSVGWDIKRMYELYDNKNQELNGRIKGFDSYTYYGLILTDIWVDDKAKNFKKKVYESFKKGDFFKQYETNLFNLGTPNDYTTKKRFLDANPYCDIKAVNRIAQYSSQQLYLLSFLWELK